MNWESSSEIKGMSLKCGSIKVALHNVPWAILHVCKGSDLTESSQQKGSTLVSKVLPWASH